MTPPTISRVFQTAEFNNRTLAQDPGSITRLKLLNDIGRSDGLMSRPFLTASANMDMSTEIYRSRDYCDAAIETGDLDTYIEEVRNQIPRVLSCEGKRKLPFVPMPALPPEWAHRGFCTEMCGEE